MPATGSSSRSSARSGPATDPDCDPVGDGEVTDLTVDPHKRHAGHGSRLMQASVDTLKADRFTRAVTWLAAQDDETRAFLTAAGWAIVLAPTAR